jgi:hypothetical protein
MRDAQAQGEGANHVERLSTGGESSMRKARAYDEPRTDAGSCDCEHDARGRGASHAIFQDKNLTADFAQFAQIMRRLKVGDTGVCIESALVPIRKRHRPL